MPHVRRKMKQYRITKYDPSNRDAAGSYTKSEWTSFGDIGRSFDAGTLSKEDYLRVESAYIEAVHRFLFDDPERTLTAQGVENHLSKKFAPSEGEKVNKDSFESVCRSILREEFWCRLESEDSFVHFGYDYYMYIGTDEERSEAIEFAKSKGLFVERSPSPYLESNEQSA